MFFFPILFGGFDNHDICSQTSTTEIFTVTKSDLPLLLLHLLLDQVIIKEYDYYNVDSVVPISFYDHYHYSYLLWLYTYTTTIPFFLGEIHPPIFFLACRCLQVSKADDAAAVLLAGIEKGTKVRPEKLVDLSIKRREI